MAELSPAAQAVLDAAARRYGIDGDLQDSIATALRAAATNAAQAARLRQRDLLLRLISEAPVVESTNDH